MPKDNALADPPASGGDDACAPEPVVRLEAVTLRLRERRILPGTDWTIRPGERWAVLGPNGAGKTTLVRALTGEVPVVGGRLRPAEPQRLRSQSALVSFERGRRLLLRAEAHARGRDFAGDPDPGLRVEDLLPPERSGAREAAAQAGLGIERLRGRRIAELSTGELRRLQIALALAAAPRLLILDEPCEGLDAEARAALAAQLGWRLPRECALVWVTHRPEELPAGITHLLAVREGRVVFQGRAGQEAWARLGEMLAPPAVRPARPPYGAGGGRTGEVRIALRGVRVMHRGATVFEDFSWTVRDGEHWAVLGPNGSGKSTLLRLVTGEHPQAYANRIEVLGARLGGGRTLREHRRDIGWVSAELHVGYSAAATARDVVLSGRFDSIGLYRRVPEEACAAACRLLAELGARELAERPFLQLSAGEQRLVLLARALVKPPRILILDEPCQGLDPLHRRRFLDAVDRFAAAGRATVICVAHEEGDLPGCITHRLRLVRPAGGPTRAGVEGERRRAVPD